MSFFNNVHYLLNYQHNNFFHKKHEKLLGCMHTKMQILTLFLSKTQSNTH